MVFWVLTIIVYTFFIYGVIAFLKNIYSKYINDIKGEIRILIKDANEVEWLINILKRNFHSITIITEKYNEEVDNMVKIMSNDVNIKYEILEDIKTREEVE
ncbi:hypothetical protein [Thermohalobacter berrensis]|uniref:Uncharacterized protein n=1 Tax=Thermohalobacter berrensis TaxID=99594 RepID=A0A419T4L2_9FIRM|nr:hypothetical protein [Thermohalobacter berrensis]RKD32318.1 hypothetical protein BET03_03140 [Thermohalobacter berrensis]